MESIKQRIAKKEISMKLGYYIFWTIAVSFVLGGLFEIDKDITRLYPKPDTSSVVVQQLGELTITYYTDNPAENMNTLPVLTASGDIPFVGGCAISRDIKRKYDIEFGDILYIQNKGFYVINDLMAWHKKNRADIFVTTKTKANTNGKHKSLCWLIKSNN